MPKPKATDFTSNSYFISLEVVALVAVVFMKFCIALAFV